MFRRPDQISYPLYAVTALFNSARYRSRWKLHDDFELMCERAGVPLYSVEVAFGDRQHVLAPGPQHILLRTWDEWFMKENAINIGVQHLTRDHPEWQAVAWLDNDIHFARYDWQNETVHRLQHHPVVQMWSHATPLDINHEPQGGRMSIAERWQEFGEDMWTPKVMRHYKVGGWGLAWAARREWWDGAGGLIDFCVTGGGDWFMGHAMFGNIERPLREWRYSPGYREALERWQDRLEDTQWRERPLVKNVGVVPGTVFHYYHGSVEGRQYKSRAKVLQEAQFDPQRDLKRNAEGLWQLADGNPKLRRGLQHYFATRNEDG